MRWKISFEIETGPQSNGPLWIPFNINRALTSTRLLPPGYVIVSPVVAEVLESDGTSETAPDGEPIRTYHVGVYEPAVDPGGYNDIFSVRASNPVEAQRKALEQAYATWRDAHGIEVFSVKVAS